MRLCVRSIECSSLVGRWAWCGILKTVRRLLSCTSIFNFQGALQSMMRYAHVMAVDNSQTDWMPTTKWLGKLKDIVRSLDDSTPRYRHEEWAAVFDGRLRSTPFTVLGADPLFSLPLGEGIVKWTVWLSKNDLWDRFHTISHIANLKGEQLEVSLRETVLDTLSV